jgi:hypothetical protein
MMTSEAALNQPTVFRSIVKQIETEHVIADGVFLGGRIMHDKFSI